MIRISHTDDAARHERDDADLDLDRRPTADPGKQPLVGRVFREARGEPTRDSRLAPLIGAAMRGAARPLPAELMADLTTALREDLSRVRVHTGPEAAAAARSLGAAAFALGVDIFFADGAYDPASEPGRRLIAHEVAHAVSAPASADGLEISQPGDRDERQAEAAADRYVEVARRNAAFDAVAPFYGRSEPHPLDRLHEVAGGAPLPGELRSRFEASLGTDLGGVRVHVGGASGEAARALGTHAFALGRDIHLASGAFDPSSRAGQRVLAHEVAHTVQQAGAGMGPELATTTPGDRAESEADSAARAMLAGEAATVSPSPVQIARDQPQGDPSAGAPGPLTADMFDVTGGDPSKDGSVAARPDGDQVLVEAPNITANATIAAHAGVLGHDTVTVGPTQTLMGSDRVGVYRANGATDGEIVAEYHQAAGQLRDAMWTTRGGRTVASYPEPWYGEPHDISDSNRSASVSFLDAPAIALPKEMSGGRLMEIRGTDSFITSFSAKRRSELLHLKNFSWSVPWAMQISGNRGTGAGITAAPSATGAPTTTGPIVMNAAQEWFHFPSDAAARAADNSTLLRALVVSRTRDPDNMRICAGALRAKNPHFTCQVRVRSTDSTVGSDNVQITVVGMLPIARGPFTMGDRATRTFEFNLLDIWPVPEVIAEQSITIVAQDVGAVWNSSPHQAHWPFPWENTGGFTPMTNNSNYEISGTRT